MRKLLLIATLLFGSLLPPGYAGDFESEVIDLGGILADTQEAQLTSSALAFEEQSNIAVKLVTSFYFALKNIDVQIINLTQGTYTHDSRLVILVKAGGWFADKSLSEWQEEDFSKNLSLQRSTNLNTDERVPDWLLAEIKAAMITRFGEYRNPQLGVYQALTESLEILRATIYTPVDNGIYSGLISKTMLLYFGTLPMFHS